MSKYIKGIHYAHKPLLKRRMDDLRLSWGLVPIPIELTPKAKPRMTRRDKWYPREIVIQYWEYKDALQILVRQANIFKKINNGIINVDFIIPMAQSTSKKNRLEVDGSFHLVRPDRDNIEKGLQDALWPEEDSMIHSGISNKYWGEKGLIIFYVNK